MKNNVGVLKFDSPKLNVFCGNCRKKLDISLTQAWNTKGLICHLCNEPIRDMVIQIDKQPNKDEQ